jgi:hypothetical protein
MDELSTDSGDWETSLNGLSGLGTDELSADLGSGLSGLGTDELSVDLGSGLSGLGRDGCQRIMATGKTSGDKLRRLVD